MAFFQHRQTVERGFLTRPLQAEMKSLNSNKVSEIDLFTMCGTPRSFGAGTSLAAQGASLPASHSLQLCQAFQEGTQNHLQRAVIRKPGGKSGLGWLSARVFFAESPENPAVQGEGL